ncbi:NlpC/P60 family protein [Actinomadura sp. 6N118]|uniref:C40 family peptidase n=1 Tax=Actinomadura sp. 6N118 TaxID=3375151 RepID=UPI0037BA2681
MSIPLKTACCATTVALALAPSMTEAAEVTPADKIRTPATPAEGGQLPSQADLQPAQDTSQADIAKAPSRAPAQSAGQNKTAPAAAQSAGQNNAAQASSQESTAQAPNQESAAHTSGQESAEQGPSQQTRAPTRQSAAVRAFSQFAIAQDFAQLGVAQASNQGHVARAGQRGQIAGGPPVAQHPDHPAGPTDSRQGGTHLSKTMTLTAMQQAVHEKRARMEAQWQRRADRAVRFALKQRGRPYVYGDTGRRGFDCSGLVQQAWRHAGVSVPRVAATQYRKIRNRVARNKLRPGDLVFFHGLGHVGLYLGKSRFIHAPSTGRRVSIERLNGHYRRSYVGAARPAWKPLPAIPTRIH